MFVMNAIHSSTHQTHALVGNILACPGVGNRPPSKKKIANPRGCARGGMVTGRIEPCIKQTPEALLKFNRAEIVAFGITLAISSHHYLEPFL